MSSSNRNRKGFTLVELLVTISILAILSTVSIVGYTSFIKKSAIEADESLVKQLNIFTDAYLVKHYSNLPDDNIIIADVLDESGVKPLTLQSKEYGYDLWFKCADKTFELKENYLETEGYIRVTDNISFDDNDIEKPGTTTTTPGNTTNGDNNASESTEDPVFILEDFVQNEYCDKAGYVYASDNAIFVGIGKNANQEIIPAVLLIEKIKIKSLDKDGSYQYWNIESITYLNEFVENGSINFNQEGTYEIILLLHNEQSNQRISYGITIYAKIVSPKETKIELRNNILKHNISITNITNSSFDVSITISNIDTGVYITIYESSPEKYPSNPIGYFDGTVEMEIQINGVYQIITKKEILSETGTIRKTFTGIEGTPEESNYIIIFRCVDLNGYTAEKRLQLN